MNALRCHWLYNYCLHMVEIGFKPNPMIQGFILTLIWLILTSIHFNFIDKTSLRQVQKKTVYSFCPLFPFNLPNPNETFFFDGGAFWRDPFRTVGAGNAVRPSIITSPCSAEAVNRGGRVGLGAVNAMGGRGGRGVWTGIKRTVSLVGNPRGAILGRSGRLPAPTLSLGIVWGIFGKAYLGRKSHNGHPVKTLDKYSFKGWFQVSTWKSNYTNLTGTCTRKHQSTRFINHHCRAGKL